MVVAAQMLADKEKQRAIVAMEKKARLAQEIQLKQEKQRRKIQMAKELQASQEVEIKEKMAEKFALTEVRRRAFEDERERQLRQKAEASEARVRARKMQMAALIYFFFDSAQEGPFAEDIRAMRDLVRYKPTKVGGYDR